MKLIKKEYIGYLEWIFKFFYLFLGLASFNVFLYSSQVQPLLVKVCLVLGALTLAGRLLFIKSYLKTPYWWVLALFCLSFLATIITNRQYGAAGADFKWLIWTGMLFFLLYVCNQDRSIQDYKKEFTVFSHMIILWSFLSSAASLYLMTQHYHERWYTAENELMLAGFQWGRLWGVYTDPNYGAVLTVAAVLLCGYYVKVWKGLKKIPYAVMIVVQGVYIIFSDSRTAELALIISIFFWVISGAVQKRNKGKKAAIGLAAAVVFTVLFVAASSYMKETYSVQIQAEINAMDAAALGVQNQQHQNTQKKEQTQRQTDIQKDVSNGRLALWKSGIEVWKTKPVLGVGYNSFLPYVLEKLPQTYAVNNSQGSLYVSLHNEFINILAYQGIAGIGIFGAFMVLAFVLWVRNLRKVKEQDRDYIAVLASCVLVIGISMVFLLEGIYTNSPGAFILWSFTGYIMHYCKKIGKAD